jgi:hypothetical protein
MPQWSERQIVAVQCENVLFLGHNGIFRNIQMEAQTKGPCKRAFFPNLRRGQAMWVPRRATKTLFPVTLENRSRVADVNFIIGVSTNLLNWQPAETSPTWRIREGLKLQVLENQRSCFLGLHYRTTFARRLGSGDFRRRLGWQLQFESLQ